MTHPIRNFLPCFSHQLPIQNVSLFKKPTLVFVGGKKVWKIRFFNSFIKKEERVSKLIEVDSIFIVQPQVFSQL